jgi:hypothetical protein
MNAYGTVSLFRNEDEVEFYKSRLKELGYCWELYKRENRYEFRVMVIADLEEGKVSPQ